MSDVELEPVFGQVELSHFLPVFGTFPWLVRDDDWISVCVGENFQWRNWIWTRQRGKAKQVYSVRPPLHHIARQALVIFSEVLMPRRHQPRILLCGQSGCQFRARNHSGLTQHQNAIHLTIPFLPSHSPSPSGPSHQGDFNSDAGFQQDIQDCAEFEFAQRWHIECHPLLNGRTSCNLILIN